jgi:tetratricopeptide (TPR) repeat protein
MVGSLSAQTLEQAKKYYNSGQYDKAKPVFGKFVKAQPANGNYNLWYGVCCLKTGEADAAVKYLETAVKKRITGGQLYLAQAFDSLYRFEDAVAAYEVYIADLTRLKRPTAAAEQLLEQSKAHLRMLRGVEMVMIVDSVVVDKARFLDAYKISQESGSLFLYNDFFADKKETDATVYETELKNKIYYSERQRDGKLSIFVRNKMQGEWGRGALLPGSINDSINANYPYMQTDGVTIFYAADGARSMGGYDIFVTRYNINSDTYLAPENVGMPFNSPANDYMYVIDEFNNLGWFASDRNQPAGKVCIYVFIPNDSKQVYNYETMNRAQLIRLARIHAIAETWSDKKAVSDARKRLYAARNKPAAVAHTHDFVFVIDDAHTYYQWSDFQSQEAKTRFAQYQELDKTLDEQQNRLNHLREQYADGSDEEKPRLTPGILDLEKRVRELKQELERVATEVRNTEIKTYN